MHRLEANADNRFTSTCLSKTERLREELYSKLVGRDGDVMLFVYKLHTLYYNNMLQFHFPPKFVNIWLRLRCGLGRATLADMLAEAVGEATGFGCIRNDAGTDRNRFTRIFTRPLRGLPFIE